MLALVTSISAWTPRAPLTRAPGSANLDSVSGARGVRARAPRVVLDADRCYYGRVDEDGAVLRGSADVDTGPSVSPSPSLSPAEVVTAQFKGLARGIAQNRDGVTGLDDAFQFLAPSIVEQYSLDLAKYRSIMEGIRFEGLIGSSDMEVLGTEMITDDKAVVSLRVLPKPIAGCVRMSGVADQSGITWWTQYSWHLLRQDIGPLAGCWTVEQMFPAPSTIDTEAEDATPLVAQASDTEKSC